MFTRDTDSHTHTRTRLKLLLGKYFVVITALLLIAAAGGGWVLYTTAIEPGTHQEQQVAATWQTDSEFSYGGEVVQNTPLFRKGQSLDDWQFYFTNSTPSIDGQFAFQFGGAPGEATVTVESTLVTYAYNSQFGARMWEIREPVDQKQVRASNGEWVNSSYSANVSDIRHRIDRIEEYHEPAVREADIRNEVDISVRVDGEVANEPVQKEFDYRLPINSSDGFFVMYPPQKSDQEFQVTRTVTVPNEPTQLESAASAGAALVPLLLAIVLLHGRANDWYEVSDEARQALERKQIRSAFEEWISSGTVAVEDDRTTVAVDSLEELVDTAIDSDSRVIEDGKTGVFVVYDGNVRYLFVPDWADDFDAKAAQKNGQDLGKFRFGEQRTNGQTAKKKKKDA